MCPQGLDSVLLLIYIEMVKSFWYIKFQVCSFISKMEITKTLHLFWKLNERIYNAWLSNDTAGNCYCYYHHFLLGLVPDIRTSICANCCPLLELKPVLPPPSAEGRWSFQETSQIHVNPSSSTGLLSSWYCDLANGKKWVISHALKSSK